MKRALILLSGGIDSALVLAMAEKANFHCHALSFDYGQNHKIELQAAKKIAKHYATPHQIITIDPSTFSGSALTSDLPVPKNRTPLNIKENGIPTTYVPGRNTLFIAFALVQAEILEIDEIHLGANASDHHVYPDCRASFFNSFQQVANLATKRAVENTPPKLVTPLIQWEKDIIIENAKKLHVPLELTFSCYDPQKDAPCYQCDACSLRTTLDQELNRR